MPGPQKIPIGALQAGMVLGEAVRDPTTYQTIWPSGTLLTPKHLELLARMPIASVGVLDFEASPPSKRADSIPSPPPAPKQVPKPAPKPRPKASVHGALAPKSLKPRLLGAVGQEVLTRNVATVQRLGDQVRGAMPIDFQAVDSTVKDTIHRIVTNGELVSKLIDLRCYDAYTYAHSANVMSLALLTGHALKYPVEKLRVLGIGALLHDIGKNMVPDAVLNKPDKLTPEEFQIIQSHPAQGVMLIDGYRWAIPEIKNMVFQHHEKVNGQGYPLRKSGSQISEMAQIVALVDFYDALVAERVYKKPIAPNLVYQAILNGVGTQFDERIVRAFVTFIVPYPVDALVQLNTGQIAQVVKVDRRALMRPVVLLEGTEVDLQAAPELAIHGMYQGPRPS